VTVNHDERRRRIAEVTVAVIAREGIDAATIRQIAQEVGFSTSIVTYYFANKHELLLATYQALHDETFGKVRAAYERDSADLLGCLVNMTPADEVSFNRWRAYVAFWDRASRDPQWALRRCDDYDTALVWIERFIGAMNGGPANSQKASHFLNTFIQGISIQVLMDPDGWPRERIETEIGEAIELALKPSTP
jgi:AcrR family transcriptional regulator